MEPRLACNYTDKESNPEAFRLLEDLKQSIRSRFPENVRDYTVEWDEEKNKVTGLEEFGEMVREDMWKALQQELQLQKEMKLDWRQQEQQLLESFIEEHCRIFTGREDIVAAITHQCSQFSSTTENYITLLTGESGGGKSAIFSMVYRRLIRQSTALILAHSAGVTPASVQVTSLVQRWCSQLANFLQTTDESDNVKDIEQLNVYFRALLGKAAEKTTVLLMVDALDQFETTTAARYLAWLAFLLQSLQIGATCQNHQHPIP